MKRQIEIFTAGCPVCESTVKMVQELACRNCEITIYDLVRQCDDSSCLSKIKEYDIQRIPAVAINGKLLNCCRGNAVTREALTESGVGQG